MAGMEKKSVFIVRFQVFLMAMALGLFAVSCGSDGSGSSGGGGGGGGGGGYCNPGNTYNYSSGKCCPNSHPYYYPGTHGGSAGCYASCPYVGDCGTKFTRY